jgi:hypothetical protein
LVVFLLTDASQNCVDACGGEGFVIDWNCDGENRIIICRYQSFAAPIFVF